MPKLTYWLARCNDDHRYTIRGRTENDVRDEVRNCPAPDMFDDVQKITIVFTDAFDLLEQSLCLSSIEEN